MVFQQGALFEWMNVRDNVELWPAHEGQAEGAKTAKNVDHLLDVVGLQDFKEKAVYELSGGMQQRVALARCLANDPDVILMDEPLGRAGRADPREDASLVLKLWKETGKTIILITHSVEEALAFGRAAAGDGPAPRPHPQGIPLPFADMGVAPTCARSRNTRITTPPRRDPVDDLGHGRRNHGPIRGGNADRYHDHRVAITGWPLWASPQPNLRAMIVRG